jgi:hypothetical protein
MVLNELQGNHNTGKNDRPHGLLKEAIVIWLHPEWQHEFNALLCPKGSSWYRTLLTTDSAHSSELGQV